VIFRTGSERAGKGPGTGTGHRARPVVALGDDEIRMGHAVDERNNSRTVGSKMMMVTRIMMGVAGNCPAGLEKMDDP
jgi:hypothetical protein